MTDSFNIKIPSTILRLGSKEAELLIIDGLHGDVSRDDIYDLLEQRYPERKRAVRSLLRLVSDEDLVIFNERLHDLRRDLKPSDRLRFTTTYARGICQILKFN